MSRFLSVILSITAVALPPGLRAAGLLLVCNKGEQTLGIVDPVASRQLAAVPEDGVTGHEVVASPDGKRAFVPIYGNSGVGKPGTDGRLVRVIDLATRQITATIDLWEGPSPALRGHRSKGRVTLCDDGTGPDDHGH